MVSGAECFRFPITDSVRSEKLSCKSGKVFCESVKSNDSSLILCADLEMSSCAVKRALAEVTLSLFITGDFLTAGDMGIFIFVSGDLDGEKFRLPARGITINDGDTFALFEVTLNLFIIGDFPTAGDLGIFIFVSGDLNGDNFRLLARGIAINDSYAFSSVRLRVCWTLVISASLNVLPCEVSKRDSFLLCHFGRLRLKFGFRFVGTACLKREDISV